MKNGAIETERWYDFLNLGFKLIPTAGSDFPYLNHPGADRNYVYVGEDFTVDAWFAALEAQNTFVTTGPMLTFAVNGMPMGSDIEIALLGNNYEIYDVYINGYGETEVFSVQVHLSCRSCTIWSCKG